MLKTPKPSIVNFTIQGGATWRRPFVWELDEPFTAPDLAGHTARMQLRTSPSAPPVLTLHSGVGGGITLGPEAGHIWVEFTAAVSLGLLDLGVDSDAVYEHDILVIDPAGDRHRVVEGKLTVSTRITAET